MTKNSTWETRLPEKLSYASIQASELEGELGRQRDQHRAAGATRFNEGDVVSSTGPKHGLEEAISYCAQNGSTIVVSQAHRVARSAYEFFNLVSELSARRVPLEILDFGGQRVRTDEPVTLSVRQLAQAFKEFEKANQLLRQREGISRAKENKRFKGRHPTARLQKEEIWRRFVEQRQPATVIAEALGISVPSVYRVGS